MRSLVTGGAGFIGSHVAEWCLKLGHEVVVLDDLSGGYVANVPKGVHLIKASVCDDTKIKELFRDFRFDYVYHLAAYAAEGLSHFIRRFNYTNNLLGTVSLINASVNTGTVQRFVFTSSIAVYGSNQLPMHEALTPKPEDPYGISKYAAELDLHAASDMFDLSHTVFRPHNVYGERQNVGDRYRNVIGIFMNQLMQDQPMRIFGDGQQTRAFTHVDDVAPVIAGCVSEPAAANSTFNIGADEATSVANVAAMVAKAFDRHPDVLYLPARNEVKHAYCSHHKLRRVFGRRSSVGLEDGIRRMAQWAREHGPRTSSIWIDIEVPRNLPPSWHVDGGPSQTTAS